MLLTNIGLVGFSSYTVFGIRTFVDLDCWKPRIFFLCFDGLSVKAFSVAASSVEPSGFADSGAYIIIDLCLL